MASWDTWIGSARFFFKVQKKSTIKSNAWENRVKTSRLKLNTMIKFEYDWKDGESGPQAGSWFGQGGEMSWESEETRKINGKTSSKYVINVLLNEKRC